jgi:hypothetical protein
MIENHTLPLSTAEARMIVAYLLAHHLWYDTIDLIEYHGLKSALVIPEPSKHRLPFCLPGFADLPKAHQKTLEDRFGPDLDNKRVVTPEVLAECERRVLELLNDFQHYGQLLVEGIGGDAFP